MSDYNLTGLNHRDFEHLIQALAIKVIAPGVMPFGDGPDGGREATYRGKMAYPSTADAWDGYLVIQAKFLMRPSGDSTKDGDWALSQLRADLSKFTDPERDLPKPEYYLFVTNVVLTPVQDTGSKDKASSLLEQFKTPLGLKGYDIWDYDKICRLLDGQPEIYTRYAGFITSGDVLSKMMSALEGHRPNFNQVISLFLQKELRNDQFVKLEQAGHTADQKTSLAHVFVDLPASRHIQIDPLLDAFADDKLTPGIVAEILQAGSRALRPSHHTTIEESDTYSQLKYKPEPGRYVVVGGPGQGKTTVGQFLCQIYRTTILNGCPSHTITPEAQTVLDLINQQCEADEMNLPQARRFPIRVVLDQFATDLANGEISSLFSYILRQIAVAAEHECSAEDLRLWLHTYPWLIVLDGLDEVPATSNRSQVLEKITEFWSQAAVLDADILVVATTRPQGYNDDFSPRFYNHRFLTPLSKMRALHYANRLAQARYGTEPPRKAKVLKRLNTALDQETTAHLMRTPLQITIMATLVDQIGRPPQERWRLFQQYYEVIYRRETERDIPASKILQQRRADVNAIHNRVGLLLQTESELVGNSEAQLTARKFGDLVRARMAEEGYEGEGLEALVNDVIQAALHRLVFLVGLETDRIGFEIRSLQEFTAAEALMDGGDAQVRARLTVIAPSAHWRNVFLFAAGKCFAERQFLRDMIVGICDQLNDPVNDKLGGSAYAGSRLALDILEDGVARQQPNFARSLTRLALRLMELPDEEANTRLAAIYDQSLDGLFREHIQQRLGQINFEDTIGAWIVLRSLISKEIDWALEIASSRWPENNDQQLRILKLQGRQIDAWTAKKLAELAPKVSSARLGVFGLVTPSDTFPEKLNDYLLILREIRVPVNPFKVRMFPELRGGEDYLLNIREVNDPSWSQMNDLPREMTTWAPYVSAIKFAKRPSAQTLAEELRWLAEIWNLPQGVSRRYNIPWPLAACISTSRSDDDLNTYAERAELGKLGQYEDWISAEKRWKTEGITEADFTYMIDAHWPFNSSIANIGFPFSCHSHSFSAYTYTPELWAYLFRLFETLPEGEVRKVVADLAYSILLMANVRELKVELNLTPAQAKDLFSNLRRIFSNTRVLRAVGIPPVLNDDWIEFFEWLGCQPSAIYMAYNPLDQSTQLAREYLKEPTREGLLLILGSLVVSGSACLFPDDFLRRENFSSTVLKRAALLIELANGGMDQAKAQRLARDMCGLPANLSTVQYALRTVENQKLTNPESELFILALQAQLIVLKSAQLSKTIGPLNDLIQSRPTYLIESSRWKMLGLPAIT